MREGKKKGGLAAFAKKKTAAAAVTEAELLVKPEITVEDVMRLREPCAGKKINKRRFLSLPFGPYRINQRATFSVGQGVWHSPCPQPQ